MHTKPFFCLSVRSSISNKGMQHHCKSSGLVTRRIGSAVSIVDRLNTRPGVWGSPLPLRPEYIGGLE
jgi:hypothetical protein|uniref:Uncharacterized protein n=1 Tax=Zea mays TaxID=4577 RepID=C0PNU4_MAIZE|nr:unknown [Zea mays]